MATISAGDAAVALRTFPRRWTTLVARFDDDDVDTDAMLRHPGPDGRSALECVARAADVLEEAQDHVRRAVTADRPVLARSSAGGGGASLGDGLRRIESAAPALADTVDGLPAGDLDRPAELDGRATTVRELVSGAVEEVAGLLRTAERALSAARAAQR